MLKLLLYLLLFWLILTLAYQCAASDADAHTPQPVACVYAYRGAPPGHKYAALQKCKAMQRKHKLEHACAKPRPVIARHVKVKRVRASKEQRVTLTRALNEARRLRSPRSHYVALVAAMTQESSARNLNHGHGTSVGILQLIDIHGSVSWRMRIENSAGWFLRGARKIDPRGTAPLRGGRGVIQRVQRSGHPTAYDQWVPEATNTVKVFLGGCKR